MIEVRSDIDAVVIFVDGTPHAAWLWKHFRAFQGYNNGKYTVEVLLKDARLVLEYETREMWIDVLRKLHENA